MTEEKWRTVSKLLTIDGYKNVVFYVNYLRSENEKLSKLANRSLEELLQENERLYKLLAEERRKK